MELKNFKIYVWFKRKCLTSIDQKIFKPQRSIKYQIIRAKQTLYFNLWSLSPLLKAHASCCKHLSFRCTPSSLKQVELWTSLWSFRYLIFEFTTKALKSLILLCFACKRLRTVQMTTFGRCSSDAIEESRSLTCSNTRCGSSPASPQKDKLLLPTATITFL